MKYILSGYFFCIFLYICSCNVSFNKEEKSAGPYLDKLPSFCQRLKMNILEVPDVNANPIAQIYLGDEVTLLGDSVYVKVGDKIAQYHNVRVANNLEGWAADDSLAIHWQPAAIKEMSMPMYPNADTTSRSIHTFDKADFVAVRPADNGTVRVIGRSGIEKKFIDGFVKASAVSYDTLEIGFIIKHARLTAATASLQ